MELSRNGASTALKLRSTFRNQLRSTKDQEWLDYHLATRALTDMALIEVEVLKIGHTIID